MAALDIRCRTWTLTLVPAAFAMATCSLAHAQAVLAPKAEPAQISRAGAIDLRPKFRMGTDRRIVLKQDTSQTVPQLGDDGTARTTGAKEDRVTTTSEITLVFHPVASSSDGATVDITIEAIRASRSGGDSDDSFDSTKPLRPKAAKPSTNPQQADPAGDLLTQLMESQSLESRMRPLVGERMTMRLGADGDVLDVRGGEKLVEALSPMGGGLGALATAGAGGPAPDSADLFKSIVSGPGKPSANVGESWDSSSDLDLSILGQSRMKSRSTLSSIRGSLAQIDMRGTLEPTSEGADKGSAGPKIDVSYNGAYQWDVEDGFVHSMNTRQLTTVRLNNSAKPVTITAETNTSIARSGGVSVRPRR